MDDAVGERATGGRLCIDLNAVASNYRRVAAQVGASRVAAVVKADAYGLGAARVAATLEREGCQDFFVAHLTEALRLRSTLSAPARLYVLNGLQPRTEADCADADVIPVLNSLDQARRWRALAQQRGVAFPAAVQIDSGMSRLGMSAEEVRVLAQDADFFADAPLALVMSHLACADEPDNRANLDQLERFNRLASQLPGAPRSLANSGGAFLDQAFHGQITRAGLCLYGAPPGPGAPPLAPVVSLTARVVQIRDLPAQVGVGYGLSYSRANAGIVATVAVGYADGWPRALSNLGAAFYRGVRLPIAGRVSMDSMTLDITDLAASGVRLALGDEVELIGPHQTVDDVARAAGTISYEILTGLGSRYHRTYLED